jgi:two-component system LytT family sensor kinase
MMDWRERVARQFATSGLESATRGRKSHKSRQLAADSRVHSVIASDRGWGKLGRMHGSGSSAWSSRRRLAVITGAWCYFAVLLTLNNYVYPAIMGQPVTWREAARFPALNYAIWTVFTPMVWFFCGRIRRLRCKAPVWLAAHSAFAILILLLIASIWIPFTQPSDGLPNIPHASWRFLSILFWQSVAWNLWMYWVIVGIFYGLDYYFGERDARVRAAQLEGQLAKAELEVLKSQLQPHFLFNTLNMVSSLIHTDAAGADDIIGDLGSLLRISLENHASQEVPLAEEMKAVELYLNIQRLRFQDTLTIDLQVDPETLAVRVPHLILQPLIENAFRHGISRRTGAGLLTIKSERNNEQVKVCISDNGPGSRGKPRNGGIGLTNTLARLERLYGDRASLRLHDSPSGFSVELIFPAAVAHPGGA